MSTHFHTTCVPRTQCFCTCFFVCLFDFVFLCVCYFLEQGNVTLKYSKKLPMFIFSIYSFCVTWLTFTSLVFMIQSQDSVDTKTSFELSELSMMMLCVSCIAYHALWQGKDTFLMGQIVGCREIALLLIKVLSKVLQLLPLHPGELELNTVVFSFVGGCQF